MQPSAAPGASKSKSRGRMGRDVIGELLVGVRGAPEQAPCHLHRSRERELLGRMDHAPEGHLRSLRYRPGGEELMATLHKEAIITAPREAVWDAVRDIGALHTRLVPGFVVDTRLDGEARIVTFGNGMVVREPILSLDDARCRLAWSAEGANATHYNAVLEVFAHGEGSRVVWTTDLLPHGMAESIAAMQDQALAIMKKTLEGSAGG